MKQVLIDILRVCGRRAAAFTVFAMVLTMVMPSVSWANAFTIDGIVVDVTAESPTKAREQAVAQAEKLAYAKLLRAVVVAKDRAILPELSNEDIEALVADFSVENEKSSATRYIAKFSVNFDEGRVARLFRSYGVELIRSSEQTVVLLGVYRPTPDAEPLLWENDNPWRRLLTETAVSRGLFPVVVPLGDVLDESMVSVEQALSLDHQAMTGLMKRYGADEVVVAEVISHPETGSTMMLRRYPRPISEAFSQKSSPIADDLPAALGDLAAHAVLSVAKGEKSQRSDIMIGEAESLAILVPVHSIADWVRVDSTLLALPAVKAVMLRASRIDIVQAAIQYSGDVDELRQTIERVGFKVDVYDGYWEITPNPEPATPPLQ